MIRRAWTVAAMMAPTAVGVCGLGLIVAGVWGLGGWPWALIAAGLPPAAFYLYGEIASLRGGE